MRDAILMRVDSDGVVLSVGGNAVKYPWHWFPATEQARMKAIGGQRANEAVAKERVEKSVVILMIEPFSFGKETTKVWFQQCQKGQPIRDQNNNFTDTYVAVGEREIAVLDQVWPVSAGKEKQVLKLYPLGVTDDASRNPIFTISLERALAASSK